MSNSTLPTSSALTTLTVYQCEACGSVLGDSSSFVYLSETLRTITLTDAHPSTIQVQQQQENCEIENLRGSIYFRVDCAKCCEPVGMILKNLPVHLSLLEGNVSFYVDKVTSCAIPGKSHMHNQTLFSAVMKMQEEISKIQVVILNIHQRLENIEKTFAEEDENLSGEEIKHI